MIKEFKSHLVLALLLVMITSLSAQNQVTVEHLSGVTIPYPYDLVVGKSDSLLYFYQAHVNPDSIWIDSFTCNSTGTFSGLSNLHTYHYNPAAVDTPDVFLFEYRYNKVYLHVKVDSVLVVCTVDDENNAVDHVIDIHGAPLDGYPVIYGTEYCLFNEYSIIATRYQRDTIYHVDLHNNSIATIWTLNSPISLYQFYPLGDSFLLAINQAIPFDPNLYIDSDMVIHHLTGENEFQYIIMGNVTGDTYAAIGMSNIFYTLYCYITLQQDSMYVNIIDYDDLDSVLEYDDSIISLPDNKYSCITKLSGTGGSTSFLKWFKTYQVTDGNRILYTGFPNLSAYTDPRLLQKINDDYIVALSGEAGNPIDFVLIDNLRQQLSVNTFTIDDNSEGWKIYPAGLDFYMVKDNRVHTFRLDVPQGVGDDSTIPALLDLSCYPNPFSNNTNIALKLNQPALVSITIYDTKGRKVTTLIEHTNLSANQSLVWNGTDNLGNRLPSGIYFIQVESYGITKTHKVALIK